MDKQTLMLLSTILIISVTAFVVSEASSNDITGDFKIKIKKPHFIKQIQKEVDRVTERIEKEVSRTDENIKNLLKEIKESTKDKNIGEESEKKTRENIDKNLQQFVDSMRQTVCEKYSSGKEQESAKKDAFIFLNTKFQEIIPGMLSANAIALAAPQLVSNPKALQEVNNALKERGKRIVDYASQRVFDESIKNCKTKNVAISPTLTKPTLEQPKLPAIPYTATSPLIEIKYLPESTPTTKFPDSSPVHTAPLPEGFGVWKNMIGLKKN